ncbi:MAG TPA: preprotein translocase subunit SecA [Oscillospiraceae bacterium]|nr:preprotein translocase subunit SecA [Oscillospiraceae bacterium]HNW04352.1 preprotein translocase subunit SecA [Oscillospiraceae bacterium]
MSLLEKIFGNYSQKELKRIDPVVKKILDLEEEYKAMSESALKGRTALFRERYQNGEALDSLLPEAFAACREACDRVLGMRPFPVQLVGGVVLHQGRIAEMKTGEGKTLVATLPAYLNGLTGEGVHIVTVNDYLARRDSEWMGKVYNYLGLTVGLVTHDVETGRRGDAYACDITYGTNNEFGFDYLRDNMVTYKENRVQRGFRYAIVDEVDSILIDEARTPLIISGRGEKSTDLYEKADRFARTLTAIRVKEENEKEEREDIEADYIVDEKARTATLTPRGVAKAEAAFQLENFNDPDNMTIVHHVNQAIKARGVMQRDVDYVVKDGEVIIVDEFTGRLMFGRRYNEGLHQAIEAKEGVTVAHENRTLATITFQNYFRMYDKLSGMTGTALTEEAEFREIYGLDVIEIPTNKPIVREDASDVVYKTERGKFEAVIDEIADAHEKGQPVLVGTISIEKSELLSAMLKKRGIQHNVLNAKHHDKEAEIVAQAGMPGAVTIATNMAGRGTDIVLGGNAEYLAKADLRKLGYDEELIGAADAYFETGAEDILEARRLFQELYEKHKGEIAGQAELVKSAGGLYIIGTERHESRRIDNQLRGRSGRQGDPGKSRFYISLEDDLMRLFGGERLQGMMDTLGVEEDMPIENRMLASSIENAQKKVEGRNFGIRKNVLQFDDVMNKQREIIYGQRSKVLDGEDLKDYIAQMRAESVSKNVDTYLTEGSLPQDWNLGGLRDYYLGWMLSDGELRYNREEIASLTKADVEKALLDRMEEVYAVREKLFGPELMRELERAVLLRNVDLKWMDHIDAMEDLKQGIYLRGYGQRDPVIEYRMEGFDMFDQMIDSIREDTVKMLLTIRVKAGAAPEREQVAKPDMGVGSDGSAPASPLRKKKVGRNDPCPCGSGKKYKNCCGR